MGMTVMVKEDLIWNAGTRERSSEASDSGWGSGGSDSEINADRIGKSGNQERKFVMTEMTKGGF